MFKQLVLKALELISSGRQGNYSRDRILELIAGRTAESGIILDLGCSRGETRIHRDGQTYVGLDYELGFLREFRRSYSPDTVPLVQADAACLPFAGRSLGVVYALGTFELLERESLERSLAECRRAARPDCLFFFQFANPRSIQYLTTRRWHWLGDPKYSYKPLRRSESLRLLRSHGFEVTGEFGCLLIPYYVVNRINRPALSRLDLTLSRALPWLSAKNLFICRKASSVS
jgi:SAM-dependent methyltransferase